MNGLGEMMPCESPKYKIMEINAALYYESFFGIDLGTRIYGDFNDDFAIAAFLIAPIALDKTSFLVDSLSFIACVISFCKYSSVIFNLLSNLH